MIQKEIVLPEFPRGIHLIDDYIEGQLPSLPKVGLLNIFIKHTSAAISINENADPFVREDMHEYLERLVPENLNYFKHIFEGSDDMPSHIKSSVIGVSLNIPISNARLNLGTWQGIYLFEFRNRGGARRLVLTITE
jgi:secondary thiamine-phosphate synthase enzyme